MYKIGEEEKIDFLLHPGDVVDGLKVYPGHEQERFLHGADDMKNYVVSNYPQTKKFKTYIIGGNHDLSFKKISGYNIMRDICSERSDLVYRGDVLAGFNMKGLRIEMMHPSGGISYALSYRPQRIAEHIMGEVVNRAREKQNLKDLPHVLIFGHWYICQILPSYMGMLTVSSPCTQAQTPYLKRKGLSPDIGMILFDVSFDNKGNITKIVTDYRNFNAFVKEKDY